MASIAFSVVVFSPELDGGSNYRDKAPRSRNLTRSAMHLRCEDDLARTPKTFFPVGSLLALHRVATETSMKEGCMQRSHWLLAMASFMTF